MGFLVQKVEHQCTKLTVAVSSPAEVHFFLHIPKMLCFQTITMHARLGLVVLDLNNILSESL